MTNELIPSAIVAALISSVFALYGKKKEFSNVYAGKIIEKRILAIERVDTFSKSLKIVVLGSDNSPYHQMLSKSNEEIFQNSSFAFSEVFWLSEEIEAIYRSYNEIEFALLSLPEGGKIAFLKENYNAISALRLRLDCLIANEYLDIEDIRTFIRKKTKIRNSKIMFKHKSVAD